jgi:ribosome-binding protein aMBF1 (putative translation factor)
VAPVKWLVINDINEGREELNFSEWQKLEKREQIKMLEEIKEEVEGGNMPLPIYTIMHRDASLSDEQKIKLSEWATDMTDKIFGE